MLAGMSEAPDRPANPPRLAPFHRRRPHLVRPVRIDRDGRGAGPTPAQARGPHWRQTSHGFYLPRSVERTVEQRIVEAGMVVPEYGGVTGWAALYWAGAHWLDGHAPDLTERPVAVAVMSGAIRSQPGIEVTAERLPPDDLTELDGLAITHHARSVCFEMRYAPSLRQAVMFLDIAAAADLVSTTEAKSYADTLQTWTGIQQCRDAIPLADENVWSPAEVLFRLHWVLDCRFPRPLCNHPIFDRNGNHIGTPDLLDAEAGLVGEYDGSLHLEGKRRGRDLQREAAFRRVGLEYVTMVAADHADPNATIVPRSIEARSRARFEAENRRAWTVVPPRWWTPTVTVAQRRALTPEQQARLLRRRAG